MSGRTLVIFALVMNSLAAAGQETIISGKLLDQKTQAAIPNAVIVLGSDEGISTLEGAFHIQTQLLGNHVIKVRAEGYLGKEFPVILEGGLVSLGAVYLEKDLINLQDQDLLELSETLFSEEEIQLGNLGLLRAYRDVFARRAAFDFGQAFFRMRGYGSENLKVLLNGIEMNKPLTGRADWNQWGGLNDITRNQEFSLGLEASNLHFGAPMGVLNINTRPSRLRPGTRITSSASNRTYTARLMATHNTGSSHKRFGYLVAISRRFGRQGYVDGTLYGASSLMGSFEYQFNEDHSIHFTGIYANNRKGRSAAITQEVHNLVGNRYNPYWGWQQGVPRNSRERQIEEPLLLFNYYGKTPKFRINIGAAYQFGKNIRSRLGYFNAPNPDPVYYRYLPSFYINNPFSANFRGAALAKEGFLASPQLNWELLYQANSTKQKASYVLLDDVVNDQRFLLSSLINWTINPKIRLDIGGSWNGLVSNNYAQIRDLLGASFHEDRDAFANTKNNLHGALQKKTGDLVGYHYFLHAKKASAFAQLHYKTPKCTAFASGTIEAARVHRDGVFLNEKYPENSQGVGPKISFTTFGLKGGLEYKISGRHWLSSQVLLRNQAPWLQNLYINPRENQEIITDVSEEKMMSVDLNYRISHPKLAGRLSGYYTRFQNTNDVNFFFTDSGLGSDFVQEVITQLDKLHLGVELGLEYKLSSEFTLSSVASVGKHVYASDPLVKLYFDPSDTSFAIGSDTGFAALGAARIKNHRLPHGPQYGFSLGVNYRAPQYWWLGVTANYLTRNYVGMATSLRTRSFILDPETQIPFQEATPERLNSLLEQEKLDDIYLLNMVGGKSWLYKGIYVNLFGSINNLFNLVYKTGGYEQSRNGNFEQYVQDNLSTNPSFGPKYWFGFGRTYFLNLAISF